MSASINVTHLSFFERALQFVRLLKLRLTLLVGFSALMGYLLTNVSYTISNLILFLLSSVLITGAANIVNQIIEIETDKLMDRTKERPLPLGFISEKEAIIFVFILLSSGLVIQTVYFNVLSSLISFLSFVLYSFVYTPLKRKGSIAVLVGAFPGAFPPLIGWVAATGNLSTEAFIIFGIQFIWQFPHFWAIAWVAYDDYTKAGFKLLPGSGLRNAQTALQIMIYNVYLIPIALLPYFFGITGKTSAIIATVLGLLFLTQTVYLMKTCERKAALFMMFGSFLYLPVVQIAFVLDKI